MAAGAAAPRSTRESYARNLRLHVLPHLGAVPLQQLDPGSLNRLYSTLSTSGRRGHRAGEGLSPRSVRYVHTILSRVLSDAVRWGRLVRNPATAAEPPSAKVAAEASPEMLTWTGQQLGSFLAAVADDRYGPAFHFLATTGMRRGELLGLRWADVDLGAGRVSIRRAGSP